jgi:dihydroorotase
MPNTTPPIDSPDTVELVKATARDQGCIRVLPIACITEKRKGEALADLRALAQAGVVGYSDDGSTVMQDDVLRQALKLSRDLGLPTIEHCEDSSLTQGGSINEGQVAAALGVGGMPASAEENIVARDIHLAEQTGGWIHITHVSTGRSLQLIREAKAKGISVTADVTPHHTAGY